jgi:hypothetical protein
MHETPLYHQGSVLTEENIPVIASEYDLPLDVVLEVISKRRRLDIDINVEDYPESIQDRLSDFLYEVTSESSIVKNEIVESAAIQLMGAMSNDDSFIITPDGVCTINPNKPPELVHAYQVVSNVLKLRDLGGVVDEKSAWMLGSIISSLRNHFGEEFDPSQVVELTEKSYNTIYTAEKVYEAYKDKRFNLPYSHHKEAFFIKIPKESQDLLLRKAETFGLGPKHIRNLGSIIKKMEDDQVVRNIRSKNQAEDLIQAHKENKVRYIIFNEDQWFELMGNASSIPTGRLVIDLKNLTVRKDNGQPIEIKPLRKSK